MYFAASGLGNSVLINILLSIRFLSLGKELPVFNSEAPVDSSSEKSPQCMMSMSLFSPFTDENHKVLTFMWPSFLENNLKLE